MSEPLCELHELLAKAQVSRGTHLLESMQRSSVVSGIRTDTSNSLNSCRLRDTVSQFMHREFVIVRPTNTFSMMVGGRAPELAPLSPLVLACGDVCCELLGAWEPGVVGLPDGGCSIWALMVDMASLRWFSRKDRNS